MGEQGLPPKYLYRHRGYTIDTLENKKDKSRLVSELEEVKRNAVWFSPLSDQNDPFDTNPAMAVSNRAAIVKTMKAFRTEYGSYKGLSGMDLRHEAKERGVSLNKVRQNFHDPDMILQTIPMLLQNIRSKQPICCFTDVPDNPLLWSYYSASHQSYCYVFARKNADNAEARKKVGKIKYLDQRPKISTIEILRWLITSSFTSPPPISSDLVILEEEDERVTDALVLSKSSVWKHENEWRMIQPTGTAAGYHPVSPFEFVGVNFGANCDNGLVSFVSEILGKDKEFQRMRLSESDYALEKY